MTFWYFLVIAIAIIGAGFLIHVKSKKQQYMRLYTRQELDERREIYARARRAEKTSGMEISADDPETKFDHLFETFQQQKVEEERNSINSFSGVTHNRSKPPIDNRISSSRERNYVELLSPDLRNEIISTRQEKKMESISSGEQEATQPDTRQDERKKKDWQPMGLFGN